MRYYYHIGLFVTCLVGSILSLNGQNLPDRLDTIGGQDTTSYLYLDSYDFKYLKTDTGEIDTLIGNVKIIQDSLFMTCQKAIVIDQLHAEAVGDVVIIHNDSIQIFADSLFYNGLLKIAWLYGEVILQEGSRTLHTNDLVYFVDLKQGLYKNGGTLLDGESRLVSQKGFYDAKKGMASFMKNVTFSDSLKMLKTDSLEFNYNDSQLYIVSPSRIYQDTTEIYCESGIYDISSDDAVLSQEIVIKTGKRTINSGIVHYRGRDKFYSFYIDPVMREGDVVAKGDTITYQADSSLVRLIRKASYISLEQEVYADIIEYNEKTESFQTFGHTEVNQADRYLEAISMNKGKVGITVAEGDVRLEDTLRQVTILSEILEIQDSTQELIAYKVENKPIMILKLKEDSLLLVADTLVSYSINYGDTLTIDYFRAYHRVEFLKSGVAGITDSLSFNSLDSLFVLYGHSFLWSDSTQMTGDTVYMHLKDQSLSRVELRHNAMVISEDSKGHFNQISGRYVDNYFRNEELYQSKVDGNTQLLYYVKNQKEEYVGINSTKASQMKFIFNENEIEDIRYYNNPESELVKYKPDLDFSIFNLSGFNWSIEKRPSITLPITD